ncbi:iron ABC transporter permease [Devosia epidermidihirudinis]|uniref:Iron ABC transporter permease n=1 Tax=Devosia epidermidihirudinis TaxID=1293439 RepID=A0A0F5Q598_9HYPH|nr:iron chelate uptake ABC transporter family permease subunit [Devosia epidermidihirudinis]KKC35244.1 iron ABC transporter permease [Devosia epidermidihirudinis]
MSVQDQPQGINFGRPIRAVRLFGEAVSHRVDLKTVTVCAILAVIAVVVALITISSGEYQVPLPDVVRALFGQAEGRIHMVVVEWRLPRTALALILGAALGIGGAIFQSLTRNPLGSPDIIGFDAGAYSGALVVIILLQGGYYAIAGGALVGGLITALMVYFLAYNRGVQGFRLIIVGIGVSAMLNSVNTWMLLRAKLEVAMAAAIWGAGSLNGLGLDRLGPATLVLAVLIPMALLMARPMAQLELGDDAARALGINAERSRLALLVIGVALTATVTATAGPIGFVALAAPQLARRLTGSPGVAMLPAAAMGALLLAAADYIAQRAFAPTQLPVGIVTVSLGGVYFVWLLLREARRQ